MVHVAWLIRQLCIYFLYKGTYDECLEFRCWTRGVASRRHAVLKMTVMVPSGMAKIVPSGVAV